MHNHSNPLSIWQVFINESINFFDFKEFEHPNLRYCITSKISSEKTLFLLSLAGLGLRIFQIKVTLTSFESWRTTVWEPHQSEVLTSRLDGELYSPRVFKGRQSQSNTETSHVCAILKGRDQSLQKLISLIDHLTSSPPWSRGQASSSTSTSSSRPSWSHTSSVTNSSSRRNADFFHSSELTC